jgi:hypothetical protein
MSSQMLEASDGFRWLLISIELSLIVHFRGRLICPRMMQSNGCLFFWLIISEITAIWRHYAGCVFRH